MASIDERLSARPHFDWLLDPIRHASGVRIDAAAIDAARNLAKKIPRSRGLWAELHVLAGRVTQIDLSYGYTPADADYRAAHAAMQRASESHLPSLARMVDVLKRARSPFSASFAGVAEVGIERSSDGRRTVVMAGRNRSAQPMRWVEACAQMCTAMEPSWTTDWQPLIHAASVVGVAFENQVEAPAVRLVIQDRHWRQQSRALSRILDEQEVDGLLELADSSSAAGLRWNVALDITRDGVVVNGVEILGAKNNEEGLVDEPFAPLGNHELSALAEVFRLTYQGAASNVDIVGLPSHVLGLAVSEPELEIRRWLSHVKVPVTSPSMSADVPLKVYLRAMVHTQVESQAEPTDEYYLSVHSADVDEGGGKTSLASRSAVVHRLLELRVNDVALVDYELRTGEDGKPGWLEGALTNEWKSWNQELVDGELHIDVVNRSSFVDGAFVKRARTATSGVPVALVARRMV